VAVNALCESREVTTCSEGKKCKQRFENGGNPHGTLEELGNTRQAGTTIRFKPDPIIFSVTDFKFETIAERLRESAFLVQGIKISIQDKRSNVLETYEYDEGLIAFIDYLNEGKDPMHDVISFTGKDNDIEVDIALQFTDSYVENMHSFVKDRKSTRLNSSHVSISYAVFCLKKKSK